MDINRMQQQLMSNPEMMASIMNSPMMEVRRDLLAVGGVGEGWGVRVDEKVVGDRAGEVLLRRRGTAVALGLVPHG